MKIPWSWRFMWKSYTWRFERGAIVFDLPKGWYSVSEPSIISFSSPSQLAALTITVYTDPILSVEEVERHNLEKKPFGDPRERSKRMLRQNEGSYAEEFRSTRGDRTADWIVYFLFFESATVIASINGTIEEIARNGRTFRDILNSIRLVPPTE
jgi:hypothetical protein